MMVSKEMLDVAPSVHQDRDDKGTCTVKFRGDANQWCLFGEENESGLALERRMDDGC